METNPCSPRHLAVAFRKRFLCSCGCRNWCSLDPAFRFLKWSFDAAAEGEHPSTRHDFSPWLPSDSSRSCFSGKPMLARYAVVMIKGDWSEVCNTWGFPTWSSHVRPCFKCAGHGCSLHDYTNASPLGLPWPLTEEADYDRACAHCEIGVRVLTEADRALLVQSLVFDKRKDGGHGKCLTRAIPAFGLQPQDRLEPSDSLRNIEDLGTCSLPIDIIFWRSARQSIATHRNPLFCMRLGITTKRILIDHLHTLFLGVVLCFCMHFCWLVFDTNLWNSYGTAEERLKAKV